MIPAGLDFLIAKVTVMVAVQMFKMSYKTTNIAMQISKILYKMRYIKNNRSLSHARQ